MTQRKLPAFSALWFPQDRRYPDIHDVDCELFGTAKEAVAWARGVVRDRGGGAISLAVTSEGQLVLDRFGEFPPGIERDVSEILSRQSSRAKPE